MAVPPEQSKGWIEKRAVDILWALVFGIVFAILFGVVWELHKLDVHDVPLRLRVSAWAAFGTSSSLFALFLFSKFCPRFFGTLLRRGWYSFCTAGQTIMITGCWLRYVIGGKNRRVWRFRSAIQKEYFEEEKLDVTGQADLHSRGFDLEELQQKGEKREGRPLIVTNFVRYSKLVRATVEAARGVRSRKESQMVLCVTTLNMTLNQWFNFNVTERCIHPRWVEYLDYLETRLVPREDVGIARILLVHKSGEPPKDKRIQLRSFEDLKNEVKSFIWLSKVLDKKTGEYEDCLLPLTKHQRQALIGKLKAGNPGKATQIADLESKMVSDYLSYFILPSASFSTPPTIDHEGKFGQVGEEFINRFHSFRESTNHHAYYAHVDWKRYQVERKRDTAQLPHDFFYVGLVDKDRGTGKLPIQLKDAAIDGLFCLAARPDEKLNMVYLHLLDPDATPKHFKHIENYVNELFRTAHPLSNVE